jgi:PhzF family phenazine biosynthesis protein
LDVLRYTAFSTDPTGGNPAGIVLDASGVDDDTMLATAAAVGYSETAFVTAEDGAALDVRYFSPLAEVPFCGHATIATAVAHAHRNGVGTLRFHTRAGEVSVSTAVDDRGDVVATLVSVPPRSVAIEPSDLSDLLEILGWSRDDLDPTWSPRVAYAGAWHPIIAARTRARLAEVNYDMATLAEFMRARNWTTIDLVWRETPVRYHSRNLFPPGGVVEDPATGAAAAAFGGYLREQSLVEPNATLSILQGYDMGRPSRISVTVPAEPGSGIAVSGTAVSLGHEVTPAVVGHPS